LVDRVLNSPALSSDKFDKFFLSKITGFGIGVRDHQEIDGPFW